MISTMLNTLADTGPLGFDSHQTFVIVLSAIGCGTGIIIALAGILYSCVDAMHRRRNEADLKRDMLDRGMSAEEIVKVIEAASPPENPTARWLNSWCKKK